MVTYSAYLTSTNSQYVNIYESAGGQNGYSWMTVGNKPDGTGFYFLIKNPADLPANCIVNSATLRLTEFDYSGSSSDTALTVKASRLTGAWNDNAAWNACPSFDNTVFGSMTLQNDTPDSGNYDYRDGYHSAVYWYKRYYWDVPNEMWIYSATESYSSDKGSVFYVGSSYKYVYDHTTAAYYDDYYKYRYIDITNVTADTVSKGGTGLIIWYDLPGTNDNRKYFKSINNTNTHYLPLLTVNFTPLPAPTEPTISTISTVTDGEHTFSCSYSADESGLVESSDIYYEMQISTDNGISYGDIQKTGTGSPEFVIDLKEYLGLEDRQYYYNSQAKIKVRACADYNGKTYSSGWVESNAFPIDFRIIPTAPSLTIDVPMPYEGQNVVFTIGRPVSYNTKDREGNENELTYYIKTNTGTTLGSGNAAVSEELADIGYTVGSFTSGKADLSLYIQCYCSDSEGQTSPLCALLPVTVKRFRAPVINVGETTRAQTSVSVPINIQDTGYGATQSGSQIRKVQYNIGGGWLDAALGTWSGLTNSFSISGLTAGTRYTLNVRAFNIAPAGTGLYDLISSTFTSTILEYTPKFAVLNDGVYAKSIYVGTDYSKSPAAGTIYDGTNYAVFGPGNSADNCVPKYDGTTGRLLQASSISIDDSGSVNIPSGQAYKINGVSLLNIIYPVGSVYMSVNSTSPATLFGGTWSAIASGKALVGIDTNDTDFNAAEKTGGAKTVTLAAGEIPTLDLKWNDANQKVVSLSTNNGTAGGTASSGYYTDYKSSSSTYSKSLVTSNGNAQGVTNAHNNLQPYFVVYIWKRTA